MLRQQCSMIFQLLQLVAVYITLRMCPQGMPYGGGGVYRVHCQCLYVNKISRSPFFQLCLFTPLPFHTLAFLHPCLFTPLPFYTLAFLHLAFLHPCLFTSCLFTGVPSGGSVCPKAIQ